jgi:membrane protease YdiL (CAAX protease family)
MRPAKVAMSQSTGGDTARSADYWGTTRRPLTCLVFLAPLLTAYEVGVQWLGGRDPDTLRNGADYWIRNALESLGLNSPWLVPAMILIGLLVWHIARQESWRVSPGVLGGMLAESLLFAVALVIAGQLENAAFRHWRVHTPAALASQQVAPLALMYVGAGIYEEVLFRLCLLPLCYGLFRAGGSGSRWAAALAIVVTSLAFSLAHYVGPAGETFQLFTFWFRTVAGLFFAALFVLRGFGITVGAHAAYDLIVGLVLSGPG